MDYQPIFLQCIQQSFASQNKQLYLDVLHCYFFYLISNDKKIDATLDLSILILTLFELPKTVPENRSEDGAKIIDICLKFACLHSKAIYFKSTRFQ